MNANHLEKRKVALGKYLKTIITVFTDLPRPLISFLEIDQFVCVVNMFTSWIPDPIILLQPLLLSFWEWQATVCSMMSIIKTPNFIISSNQLSGDD